MQTPRKLHKNQIIFDAEEFDRVYASYTDAKKPLNQLRVSREFYPVVSVADPNFQMPHSPAGSNSPSKKGSTKGRGKSKGKSKSKKGSEGPSSGYRGKGSFPDRAKIVLSDQCARCGLFGHEAVSCPGKQSMSGGSPSKKRVIDFSDDANFVGVANH